MSKLGFQIEGKVICDVEVDHGGWTLRASKDGKPIGKVAVVLGASNRPTGRWSYELHSEDKTKKAPDNWNAGADYKTAMIAMLKRAKVI